MAIERQESTGEQGRFKVVARMVMAMQRFKASINPTYHFGKRHEDTAELKDEQVRAARTQGRASDRTASGRTVSGQPTAAGQAHGHKGDLLLRHLPAVAEPAGGAAAN